MGVDVEIILPGTKIDSELTRKASRSRWGDLLEAGVEMYEYQPTMYHCKVMVVDDLWVSVGLILLDLTMPVMNGWQFRAEQREDPDLAGIPVVVISAGANLAEQVVPLGIQDYIRKPIQLGQLLATVGRYCGEPDGSSASA